MGRLTKNPNDIRVFGRAIAKKHKRGEDEASSAEIEKMEWKKEWPLYIRVHHAKFVAGPMENGVSLYKMMDELGANSFETTKRNAGTGKGNTEPRRAYGQRPRCSTFGRRFQVALRTAAGSVRSPWHDLSTRGQQP